MAKYLLLDGNSLAYRAFFALPTDMATASGQVTNAVYGFTNMLVYLLREHQPDGIAVAFDRPEPTFRHGLVTDYKGGREAAPDILRQQMGLVRQVVETLKIPVLELATYEADDILATLATQARDRGDDVIVVTGDRDAYQLVEDPFVKVLYNKRGVTDYVLYDEAGIEARTGVTPDKYPMYAALRGDTSDNLPGVPGVGEKTAAKLINTYGDLEGVFANIDKNTPKLRENLAEHEPRVRENYLATPLIRDVPIDCDLDDLRMGGFDAEEIRDLFAFLEFRGGILDRLFEAVGVTAATGDGSLPAPEADGEPLEVEVRRPRHEAEAVELLRERCEASGDEAGWVAVAPTWTGPEGRSAIAGLAVTLEDDVVLWLDGALLRDPAVAGQLEILLTSRLFHVHHAKALLRGLAPLGIDGPNLGLDSQLAAYLIEPSQDTYLLQDVALKYAGVEVRSPDAPPEGQLDLSGEAEDPAEQPAREAAAVARLAPVLAEVLEARGLTRLYDEIERPLVRALREWRWPACASTSTSSGRWSTN